VIIDSWHDYLSLTFEDTSSRINLSLINRLVRNDLLNPPDLNIRLQGGMVVAYILFSGPPQVLER
jgi:hypothetical protein